MKVFSTNYENTTLYIKVEKVSLDLFQNVKSFCNENAIIKIHIVGNEMTQIMHSD